MNLFVHLLLSLVLISSQACKVQNTTTPSDDQTVVNKVSQKKKATFPVQEYTDKNDLGSYKTAIFAGGCFWCTEAAFERINGVVDVISGYSGGHVDYPDYYSVGEGTTGHAESIYIYYDEEKIDYGTLLDVLFVAHDPTTLNRQGPDIGEEYRSAIYYQTEEELALIDTKIKAVNKSGKLDGKIVSEVVRYKEFWVAENYHQNYYELHPDHGYVSRISRPKVKKVIKTFPDLIKVAYR